MSGDRASTRDEPSLRGSLRIQRPRTPSTSDSADRVVTSSPSRSPCARRPKYRSKSGGRFFSWLPPPALAPKRLTPNDELTNRAGEGGDGDIGCEADYPRSWLDGRMVGTGRDASPGEPSERE